MKFQAYVIPEADLQTFIFPIDEFNEVRPIQITAGPDLGSYFLDADITNRLPAFKSTIENSTAVLKELDTDVIFVLHPSPPQT